MPYQRVICVIAADAAVRRHASELADFRSGDMLLNPEACQAVSNQGERK